MRSCASCSPSPYDARVIPTVSWVFCASVSNSRAANSKSGCGTALCISNPQQISFELAERARRAIGHPHRLTDRNGEFSPFAQRDRHVKNHAGLQGNVDVMKQAEDVALTPIGRERDADAIAGALAISLREAVAIDHLLAGIMDVRAGPARAQIFDRRRQPLFAGLVHVERELRNAPNADGAKHGGVIAVVTGAGLQRDQIAALDRAPAPSRMRNPGAWPGCHERIHPQILRTRFDG